MSYDQICADALAEVTDLRAKVDHLREVMAGVQRDREFERTRAERAEAEVARLAEVNNAALVGIAKLRAQVAEEIAVALEKVGDNPYQNLGWMYPAEAARFVREFAEAPDA